MLLLGDLVFERGDLLPDCLLGFEGEVCLGVEEVVVLLELFDLLAELRDFVGVSRRIGFERLELGALLGSLVAELLHACGKVFEPARARLKLALQP